MNQKMYIKTNVKIYIKRRVKVYAVIDTRNKFVGFITGRSMRDCDNKAKQINVKYRIQKPM